MASRLSSLLVSDGVVSVKRMEHAFQRQVIYGGSLDTILLEMNIVPEERLVQYLSKATGLPPATREETEAVDPTAVARCPVEVARIYHVVPLCFAEGALRLLVHDPVEMAVLEELANELELPVQPLVVPEYRYHLVFTRVYGGTPDARYETLARRAEEIAPSQPVGKARTIIVDTSSSASLSGPVPRPATLAESGPNPTTPSAAPSATTQPATPSARRQPTEEPAQRAESPGEGRRPVELEPPPRRPERRTMEMATAALARRSEGERVRESFATTEPGLGVPGPLPAQPGSGPVAATPAPRAATPAGHDAHDAHALGRQDTTPLGPTSTTPTAPTSPGKRNARLGPAAQAVMNLPPELPTGPLAPEAAMEALPHADDRDLIFNLLLRAMRDRVHYAALFTVQEGSAIGRIAIDGDEIDRADIARVLISLDEASPFRTVVRSVAPYFGTLATGTPEIDIMLAALGGMPSSGLLLPVVLRGRVVAIALGHSGEQRLEPSALAALLPVASRAAEALSRLIVKTKAQRRVEQTDAATDRRPGARAATAEPTTQEMPHPPIDSVLSAVQSDDPAVARAARVSALARPAETLSALGAHFPGALRIERYELEGRAIPAAEHGPLLELTVAMGAAASDLLIEKMRDIDRDIRYYAALCAAESRPRAAVDSLVERLFDSDYGVRSIAIDALKGYPAAVLDQGLEPVREALLSNQSARVQAAANALAKIGDAAAVPVLIDVLDQGTDAAEHARRALVKLTKQDCGTGAGPWRAWWDAHRERHRMEWLIEALGQTDENLASEAAEELRQATGEYFGFHHDLPPQERDQAQQRWVDWWERSGRERFAGRGARP